MFDANEVCACEESNAYRDTLLKVHGWLREVTAVGGPCHGNDRAGEVAAAVAEALARRERTA